MIVPARVESKIRQLLESVRVLNGHDIEWSGVLFYKYTGTLENKDLVVTCEDVFPMDIGSEAFTKFEITPDLASYMAHNDLMDCQQGLIHSHHTMDTFFSGTDLNTLQQEGNDRNNFVSLIVNNAGKYNAAITSKVKVSFIGTEITTSPFFDQETPTPIMHEKTGSMSYISYSMFNVEVETPHTDIALEKRINQLWEAKKQRSFVHRDPYFDFGDFGRSYSKRLSERTIEDLIDEEGNPFTVVKKTSNTKPSKDKPSRNATKGRVSPSVVKKTALQIMSGDLTATYSNMNYTLSKEEVRNIHKLMINRLSQGDMPNGDWLLNQFADDVMGNTVSTIMNSQRLPENTFGEVLEELTDKVIIALKKHENDLPYITKVIEHLTSPF